MKKIYISALVLLFGITITNAQKFAKENFESGAVAANWEMTGNWIIGDVSQAASAYFNPGEHSIYAICNDDSFGPDDTVMEGSITSASVDLTTVAQASLVFDGYFRDEDYQGNDETAKVYITEDDGDTWVELFDSPGEAAWVKTNIDLVDYLGKTIRLRFTYTDVDLGWNYGWAVDDIYVINPLTNDILLGGFTMNRFVRGGEELDLTGTITNLGTEELTAIDLTWTDGTNTYTETVSGLTVGTFESMTFTHETKFSSADVGEYAISIEGSMPNGVADMDMEDNAGATLVSTVVADFPRRMVAEEATGTWCPWCPRGEIFMNQMAADFPDDFIGIAVHNNDPMVVTEHDSNINTVQGFSGYPNVAVDRVTCIDPSELPGVLAGRLAAVSPANISGTADFVTDEAKINIDLTAEFFTDVSDRQFTVSVILVEDGVTGTTTAYNQANAYAGGGNGVMGGYESLPNPVPASQMVYDHVSRALIGGWDGDAATIPEAVTNGSTYSASYSIDVDPTWNADNMHAVILVTDVRSGNVHNAAELEIQGLFTGNEEPSALSDHNLFPNPAKGQTQLTFSVEELRDVDVVIYNNIGQNVWNKSYGEMIGNQSVTLDISDLSSGAYTLVIKVGEGDFIAKQLQVVK